MGNAPDDYDPLNPGTLSYLSPSLMMDGKTEPDVLHGIGITKIKHFYMLKTL